MEESNSDYEHTKKFSLQNVDHVTWVYHSTIFRKKNRKQTTFNILFNPVPEVIDDRDVARRELLLGRLEYSYFKFLQDEQFHGKKYSNFTQKQLSGQIRKIQDAANKFHKKIKKLNTPGNEFQSSDHIIGALITGLAQENLTAMDEKKLDSYQDEVCDNIQTLDQALAKFIAAAEKYLNGKILYDFIRDEKKRVKPETTFSQGISEALTEYFGDDAGYARGCHTDQNSARGWRIESISYLLSIADVNMTNNQILDAILSKDRK